VAANRTARPRWRFTLSVGADGRDRVAAERFDLAPGELPTLPRQEVAQRKGANGDPLQLVNLVAERGQHPADFAILALVEHHLQHGALLVLRTDRDPLRMHLRLGEPDAPPQLVDQFFRRHARDLHEVLLLDTIPGVSEEIREPAVVGEQDQPLAHPIEPTDREQPLLSRH
jgi:hypothetical protein